MSEEWVIAALDEHGQVTDQIERNDDESIITYDRFDLALAAAWRANEDGIYAVGVGYLVDWCVMYPMPAAMVNR